MCIEHFDVTVSEPSTTTGRGSATELHDSHDMRIADLGMSVGAAHRRQEEPEHKDADDSPRDHPTTIPPAP